jgi:hypothetical protein
MPETRRKIKSEIKLSLLEREERKASHNGPQEGDGGEGLCLHSEEDQDLCACATAEELIFNTRSEHQTAFIRRDYSGELHVCVQNYGEMHVCV